MGRRVVGIYLVKTLALLTLIAVTATAAPNIFRVKFETSAGDFVMEVHRDWAPRGADQFYRLVRAKYFDDSRFFRVVAGKWVQFGIAGDPTVALKWRNRTIEDDPVKQSNTLGFAAFAFTKPGTRATEIYINLGDNTGQDTQGFAPFGKVVQGMDVVQKLYSGYGENSGGGMRAGHQDPMFQEGKSYLDREYPKLDRLIRAKII